jgi:hypothetical protein
MQSEKRIQKFFFPSVQKSLMPECIAVPWIAIRSCAVAAWTTHIPRSDAFLIVGQDMFVTTLQFMWTTSR